MVSRMAREWGGDINVGSCRGYGGWVFGTFFDPVLFTNKMEWILGFGWYGPGKWILDQRNGGLVYIFGLGGFGLQYYKGPFVI